jgi:hypothetical protein
VDGSAKRISFQLITARGELKHLAVKFNAAQLSLHESRSDSRLAVPSTAGIDEVNLELEFIKNSYKRNLRYVVF